jgi:hypothetical protein
MKQRQKIIIFSAIGLVFLLFWFVVLTLVIKYIRGSKAENNEPVVVDVTLCDESASDLCVVSFGANNINRMVINFQLPSADYISFYIKATNRETVSVYACEVDESTPTSAYCTGVRTPLGETIDIEVYSTDEDILIARGTFLVSAIALSTPISLPADTAVPTDTLSEEETPTPDVTSPSP